MAKDEPVNAEVDPQTLAAVMVEYLKSLDGYPYVNAVDIRDTDIDGPVDMVALSEVIIRHIRAVQQ